MAFIRSDCGYYTNITTDTTTLVRAGPGGLLRIIVNTVAATEVITLWDSLTASGTKIGTITLVAGQAVSLEYRAQFNIGLTVQTATAASDITVVWIGG